MPIAVLLGAIVMELLSFRTAIIESNRVRGTASWVRFVRRAKAPELPVVLLEDLGALVGLLLALIGVGMSLITHNPYWDAGATAAIGLLLCTIAVVLAVEMSGLLVGEGATEEQVLTIEAALAAGDDIERVVHMRTLHLGPDNLLVAAKIAVRPTQSGDEIAAAVNAAEARVRAAVPIAMTIYIEPDLYRAEVVD